MTKTRKARKTRKPFKPAEMEEGRLYTDLGSCGWYDSFNGRHVEGHDPTETTDPSKASCLRYNGRDYHETGKEGTRTSDGTHSREFSSNDGQTESRLWLGNDGRIDLDD